MPKVKYGTEEYRNAYNKRSLANYDFNSKTYNLARPLPDIVATPKNNLDLGQVVRNGTSKIGKPIGVAITELAALHPAIGLAKDGVIFNNVYDNGYSNNQVIFSFKDLIDGITTKKAAGK